jgi:hypothetical protein
MSSPRATVPPPISIASKSDGGAKGRARSSSIVAVQEVGGNGAEEMLDQSVYINRNSEWVNGKGALVSDRPVVAMLTAHRCMDYTSYAYFGRKGSN